LQQKKQETDSARVSNAELTSKRTSDAWDIPVSSISAQNGNFT